MSKNRLVRKTITWSLIITLANPVLPVAPAFARDTDIYLTSNTVSTTGSINSGSTTLTVASIENYQVGTSLYVDGAGIGGTPLQATISAINSVANTITLATAASNTVTNAIVTNANTTVSEPNVLLILGTNDRMNIPEAWREYTDGNTTGSINSGSTTLTVVSVGNYTVGTSLAIDGAGVGGARLTTLISAINGNTITVATAASTTVTNAIVRAYDSHVEYLWNDINIISNNTSGTQLEVTAENAGAISDAPQSVTPFSPWGFWDSTAPAQQLWLATKTYANSTLPGDPGPMYNFRNYFNDYSWLYWLPAGTSITDLRLTSVSFNRFRAGPSANYTAGTRGGIVFPPTAPTTPYNYTTVNNYSAYNLCAQTNVIASTPLAASTVMAPTGAPQNAGVWLNQQWIRWEPYLGLSTVGNSGYPGSNAVLNTYYEGYLNSSFEPPVNGFPVPPVAVGSYPGAPYRDSLNSTTAVSTGATGLPIRIESTAVVSPSTTPNGTKSYAGWTDVAADLGGYTFVPSVLNGLGTTGYPYSCPLTGATTTTCTLATSYAVLSTVLGFYSVTNELGGTWPLTAFEGNRDSAPAFGMSTGAPAYYDTTVACNPTTGPSTSGDCIGITFGGTGAQTATWTLTCGYTPLFREYDASSTLRSYGGSCSIRPTAATPPTCSDPRTAAAGYVAPHLNCGDFAPPVGCATPTQIADPAFDTLFINTNCSAAGTSTLTVGACAWSGRQNLFIEGQGYYYYGGTCQETGGGAASTTSCSAVNNTLTLDGVSRTSVVGPVTTAVFDAGTSASTGCTNAIAAGNYAYGGTCGGGLKYTVPAAYTVASRTTAPTAAPDPSPLRVTTNPLTTCAFSGGTALTIRGNSQTFNRACATTEANTTQFCLARYGSTCDNSASNAINGYPLNNTAVCPNATTTLAIAAQAGTTYYYQAYKLNADTTYLYHECLSDGPLALNPGSGYPTSYMRTFATNPAPPAATTATANTALTQPYVTPAAPVAQRYVANSAKNIDLYSVNYLNWLFGAKACRDVSGNLITSAPISATATCNPIGRKTRLQIAKDALSAVVQSTNGVRIGLETLNKTDTSLNANGGNIEFAIRRMGSNASDLPAYNNRAALVGAIQAVVASSRSPLTDAMYEAYLYFSGRAPVYGTLSTPAESGGTVSAGYENTVGTTVDPVSTFSNVDLFGANGKYNSPMMDNPSVASPAGCQKNYIVFISNGQPEDDYDANQYIKGPTSIMRWKSPLNTFVSPRTDLDSNFANGTEYNQIPAIPGGPPYGPVDLATTAYDGGYIWLDELAYFMSNADVSPGASDFEGENLADQLPGSQTINTYTIGFAGVSTPVLANAAQSANGSFYIANNAQQLGTALTQAFVAISNWTPTAAFLTVPLNNLNRGQSSDNVFLAFFGPSPQETWQGTLKKFELGTTAAACGNTTMTSSSGATVTIPNTPCLIGQTVLSSGLENIDTIDPLTNQTIVDPTASSFWGPSNLQDGDLPNKGGDGYQLIANTPAFTPDTRHVYTFLSNGVSNSTNLTTPSNSTNPSTTMITPAMVGTGSNATWETLLSYIRGGSTADPNCTDGNAATPCTTWATWPHFDIQHSRPTAVTYDGTQNPPIQEIFYVQDNGMLTAVDANTGKEQWSFLIEEALPQLSTMAANVNGPEIYVADGSPAVFYDDENGDGIIEPGTDRVWLFFGLRRGGRVLYAVDITNKDQPQFMWKITANSGSGMVCMGVATCTPNALFNQLGQTWSTPQIGPILSLGAAPGYIPALIFAGGYDPLEDALPWVGDAGQDDIGRAVYVIRADNTQVLNSWGVGQSGSYLTGNTISKFSIPSDVTALNTQNSAQGFLDRVYVGDMGGNVWRFDISNSNPSLWEGEQLAKLSDAAGEKRKFFFPPAVAPQNIPFLFDGVYIGSGDTEHPICSTAGVNGCAAAVATDRIFMLMDDPSLVSGGGTPNTAGPSTIATPITTASLVQLADTNTCGVGGTGVTCAGQTATVLVGKQGWYRKLDVGEKVTNSPTVFFNELTFATYAPAAQINACTPPGQGRLNQIGALLGNLEPLNGGTVASASDRYYASFIVRGYISTGQLLVVGNQVINTAQSGGIFHSTNVGTIGGSTKIYWYMEPEQ